jgi:FixJ family two-component response regulator
MRVPFVAVVDEDASARRALTRLLQAAQLRIVAYSSATEFLATWIASPPTAGSSTFTWGV